MSKIVCFEDKAFLLGLMATCIISLYCRPWRGYHIFSLLRNVVRGTRAPVDLYIVELQELFCLHCEDILQLFPFTKVLNMWDINSGDNGLNMFSCMGSQLDMGDRERKALKKVHCAMKINIVTVWRLNCY